MEQPQIDYSEVVSTPSQTVDEWEPPVHKYFGPKDAKTGKMKSEPVYQHQEYPRTVYAKKGDKIQARLVASDAEFKSLGAGWTKNLMELGYYSAPSQEQLLEMRKRSDEKTQIEQAQKPEARDTLHVKR